MWHVIGGLYFLKLKRQKMSKACWSAGVQCFVRAEWLWGRTLHMIFYHMTFWWPSDNRRDFFKLSEWNHQAKDWTKRTIEVAFPFNSSWTHILDDFHIVLLIWLTIAFLKQLCRLNLALSLAWQDSVADYNLSAVFQTIR